MKKFFTYIFVVSLCITLWAGIGAAKNECESELPKIPHSELSQHSPNRHLTAILEGNELFTLPTQPRTGVAERVIPAQVVALTFVVRTGRAFCNALDERLYNVQIIPPGHLVSLSSVNYHVFALRKIII